MLRRSLWVSNRNGGYKLLMHCVMVSSYEGINLDSIRVRVRLSFKYFTLVSRRKVVVALVLLPTTTMIPTEMQYLKIRCMQLW